MGEKIYLCVIVVAFNKEVEMMYTTNASPENKVVPYWNEIKKLSREDRSLLADLISESLESEELDHNVDEFLSKIDEDLMRRTAACVHKQYMQGKCIPHNEVMGHIKENMGWK